MSNYQRLVKREQSGQIHGRICSISVVYLSLKLFSRDESKYHGCESLNGVELGERLRRFSNTY